MSFLLEPLQYEFMQRGMIAAVLVGIVCAVVGTYVVLRGMAFFGDALAHTILPGIAPSNVRFVRVHGLLKRNKRTT